MPRCTRLSLASSASKFTITSSSNNTSAEYALSGSGKTWEANTTDDEPIYHIKLAEGGAIVFVEFSVKHAGLDLIMTTNDDQKAKTKVAILMY